jgi:hypothetical protein
VNSFGTDYTVSSSVLSLAGQGGSAAVMHSPVYRLTSFSCRDLQIRTYRESNGESPERSAACLLRNSASGHSLKKK